LLAKSGPLTESTGNPLVKCSAYNVQNGEFDPTARAALSTESAKLALEDNSSLKKQLVKRNLTCTVFCGFAVGTAAAYLLAPILLIYFFAIKHRTIMALDTCKDFLLSL